MRSPRFPAGVRIAAVLALFAFAAFTALRYAPVPFAWLFVLGTAGLLLTCMSTRATLVRVVAFNLALLFVALAVIEGWLAWRHAGSRLRYEQSAEYRMPDALYGITGVPFADAVVSEHHGDTLVWQAHYRLDRYGMRITPGRGSASQCVVFFGCSFTFGDGVEDEQTMPYRVAARSGGRIATTNLGVGGAGPHQMLARLESGGVAELAQCSPTSAIYTAIPHHVYRVAGKPARHNFGPLYVLREDGGRPRRDGRIEDRRGLGAFLPDRLAAQLEKSHLYVELTDWPRVTDDDIMTFVAVVKAADERFRRDHPGTTFDVLLWDDVPFGKTPLYQATLSGLRAAGLRVHPVADILPGYEVDRSRYQLAAIDRHPNARAYDEIAAWMVTSLFPGDGAATNVP